MSASPRPSPTATLSAVSRRDLDRATLLIVLVIVNGEKNNLQLHLNNHSKKNYTLVAGGASYHDVEKHWALVS
jgi:hypothetical protein